MQETNHTGSGTTDHSNADRKRRIDVFAKKIIGAIFYNACGSKTRTQEKRRTHISSEDYYAAEMNKTRHHHIHHPCPFEEIRVAKVHATATRKGKYGRNCKKRCRKRRLTSSLYGIFRKSTGSGGFNLRKYWKTIKIGVANNAVRGTKGSGFKPSSYGRTKVGLKRKNVKKKKEKKKNRDGEEVNETNSELELCKKRILMGEKCRPLNISGVLHYDKEGILLPEEVFLQPIEE